MQTRILDMKPYFKPTNKFQSTHFNSCYPPPPPPPPPPTHPSTFKGVDKGRSSHDTSTLLRQQHLQENVQISSKKIQGETLSIQASQECLHLLALGSHTLKTRNQYDPQPLRFSHTMQAQITPENQLEHNNEDPAITEEPIIVYKKTKNIGQSLVSSSAGRTKQPKQTLKLLLNSQILLNSW